MRTIRGKYIQICNVDISDAEFILSLRCDVKKSKFLHKTENNIEKQRQYIENVLKKDNEFYFIAENMQGDKIGTYRIYDLKTDSFCIGSWLMSSAATAKETLETDYLCRKFAFEELGFKQCHFDVRKENKKVVAYHKLMGAKLVGETDLDFLFECTKDDYYNAVKRVYHG